MRDDPRHDWSDVYTGTITMNGLLNLLKNDDAATAVEYAVMLAAILLTLIVGVIAVGESTSDMYTDIDSEMTSHGVGP
ncbi:MAG: Flp family type IVb pilin [Planctomycetaceae bacterium]|mgnify:CR=1 FL=1|jgi:pilus assembly protein Flp/PilA|nr:Flp family type IVb pilin [Planctomycetaceae bacterium]MBT6487767.1 Flp family type IVb pilin [Planctomycetaceae bacterium]